MIAKKIRAVSTAFVFGTAAMAVATSTADIGTADQRTPLGTRVMTSAF